MALSSFVKLDQIGNTEPYMVVFTVDGDSAYVAGGTAAFAAFVQNNCDGLTPITASGFALDGSLTAEYDLDNDKLLVFDPATGAQPADGDLSATSFQFTAWCK